MTSQQPAAEQPPATEIKITITGTRVEFDMPPGTSTQAILQTMAGGLVELCDSLHEIMRRQRKLQPPESLLWMFTELVSAIQVGRRQRLAEQHQKAILRQIVAQDAGATPKN